MRYWECIRDPLPRHGPSAPDDTHSNIERNNEMNRDNTNTLTEMITDLEIGGGLDNDKNEFVILTINDKRYGLSFNFALMLSEGIQAVINPSAPMGDSLRETMIHDPNRKVN